MVKKVVLIVLATVGVFTLGFFTQEYIRMSDEKSKQTSSVVLLEKVKKVFKLVTVEGSFSELYTHEDYSYYDFYPFRKKALLKVNAQVTAGYDLEQITFDVDEITKTIYIRNIPEPEIMSIDPQISYYDLSEGTFNSFSTNDLTELNQNARKFIEDKARKSSLLVQAKKEGESNLLILKMFLEEAGYKVEFVGVAPILE